MQPLDAFAAVQEARQGSREAFIGLIRDNEVMMYAIARNLLKSETDTADAIQEAILNAYNGIGSLREPAYFRTWLVRILIHACRQINRNNSKYVPMLDGVEPADPHGNPAAQLELEDLLSGLDMGLKEVVVLYYMDDISVKDIAQMLDLTESNVKSRLYRARMKLAALMKETEAWEGLR